MLTSMENKRISTLLLYAILLSTPACQKQPVSNAEATSEAENLVVLNKTQIEAAGIETGQPEMRQISTTITVNGILDVPPQNLVSIAAPMGGFVKKTHLLQGMHVTKGEELIELQDAEYIQLQQDYIETQSQLDYAALEYTRQQELAKENINAQKTLQQSRANFETLRARTEGLKARLAIINIDPEKIRNGTIQKTIKLYSPISGYVTEMNVNLGQYVQATTNMIKIVDYQHLHVELFVFEQDLPRLKIGQMVTYNLINETTRRTATIHLIGRQIMEDRTVRIHCHLDKEDPDLFPGMYVKASIETGSHEVSVLPDEAIVNFEGTSYVFTTGDGLSFRMEEIKIGSNQEGFTEVLPSAEQNERQIVTRGAFVLLSRLKNVEEE